MDLFSMFVLCSSMDDIRYFGPAALTAVKVNASTPAVLD